MALLLEQGVNKRTATQQSLPHRCSHICSAPKEEDRPSCPQKHCCRCSHPSSKFFSPIGVSHQDHKYGPGRLCCNLSIWQELRKCSCLQQEVALWAEGSTSFAQTSCRKHSDSSGAMVLVRWGRGGSEKSSGASCQHSSRVPILARSRPH